ncbi:MAG: hypothetical protein EA388_05430 [Nitriliruptor sp.]|nr:MAG: hypothetical protein EA388_05430 [Nitriliruptor sp.]
MVPIAVRSFGISFGGRSITGVLPRWVPRPGRDRARRALILPSVPFRHRWRGRYSPGARPALTT